MTKEEAIIELNTFKIGAKSELGETALDIAIKELKEQSTLDKIRAEIEKHCGLLKDNHCKYCSYCNSVMGVREILEVIDKYRESEGK